MFFVLLSLHFPAILALEALDKECHGFIGTPCLDLAVDDCAAMTLATHQRSRHGGLVALGGNVPRIIFDGSLVGLPERWVTLLRGRRKEPPERERFACIEVTHMGRVAKRKDGTAKCLVVLFPRRPVAKDAL